VSVPPNASVADLLAAAQREFNLANQAYASGDLGGYQDHNKRAAAFVAAGRRQGRVERHDHHRAQGDQYDRSPLILGRPRSGGRAWSGLQGLLLWP